METRNDLAIFLRDTQHLKYICTLLWVGAALNGAISFNVDQSKSNTSGSPIEALPKLCSEPLDCASTDSQVDYVAFPSFKDLWIDLRS